jgi:DNA gyrase subunit A
LRANAVWFPTRVILYPATLAARVGILLTCHLAPRFQLPQGSTCVSPHVERSPCQGLKGIRDESTDEIRVVIDVKPSAHPQTVLNYIYKHTQLEEAFHFNMVALVDGVPQTLSLKNILEEFLKHREVVVTRRTKFELNKALDREHILLGLKKALDHIDEIIALIKKSKDTPEAHDNLMKKFKFSDRQATAILEMKLQRLAGLERKKIEDELYAVQQLIKELQSKILVIKYLDFIISAFC